MISDPLYRQLPKIELHAHLNGSLSEKTLKQLSATRKSIQDYQKINVLDVGPQRTLAECFEVFQIAHNVTNNPTAVTVATQAVIQEFADDGVIYLELRTTPRHEPNTMTKRQYIDAVVDGITRSRETHPEILVKLILSLDRKQTVEEATETADLAMEYGRTRGDIVRAIDVSGDPTKGTWFEPVLRRIRNESDLCITVHCAEVPNEDEIAQIIDFKPDRIGHGTCILPGYGGSERLWQKLLQRKIPVECCLTSNVKTRTIESYAEHHVQHLLAAKHPFTLATDDKGVFATSLSAEFAVAAATFNLGKQQLGDICYSTVDYTFLTEDEKQDLREKIKRQLKNISDTDVL